MMDDPRTAKVVCVSLQPSDTFNVRSPNQSDVQMFIGSVKFTCTNKPSSYNEIRGKDMGKHRMLETLVGGVRKIAKC
jgi:hypothetical protein